MAGDDRGGGRRARGLRGCAGDRRCDAAVAAGQGCRRGRRGRARDALGWPCRRAGGGVARSPSRRVFAAPRSSRSGRRTSNTSSLRTGAASVVATRASACDDGCSLRATRVPRESTRKHEDEVSWRSPATDGSRGLFVVQTATLAGELTGAQGTVPITLQARAVSRTGSSPTPRRRRSSSRSRARCAFAKEAA